MLADVLDALVRPHLGSEQLGVAAQRRATSPSVGGRAGRPRTPPRGRRRARAGRDSRGRRRRRRIPSGPPWPARRRHLRCPRCPAPEARRARFTSWRSAAQSAVPEKAGPRSARAGPRRPRRLGGDAPGLEVRAMVVVDDPIRILTVTGTVPRVADRSLHDAPEEPPPGQRAPPPRRVTLGTGQLKLRSTWSARSPSTTVVRPPRPSPGPLRRACSERGARRRRTRSSGTSTRALHQPAGGDHFADVEGPAPCSRHSRRKPGLVMSGIGARTTGVAAAVRADLQRSGGQAALGSVVTQSVSLRWRDGQNHRPRSCASAAAARAQRTGPLDDRLTAPGELHPLPRHRPRSSGRCSRGCPRRHPVSRRLGHHARP